MDELYEEIRAIAERVGKARVAVIPDADGEPQVVILADHNGNVLGLAKEEGARLLEELRGFDVRLVHDLWFEDLYYYQIKRPAKN